MCLAILRALLGMIDVKDLQGIRDEKKVTGCGDGMCFFALGAYGFEIQMA